MTVSHCGPGMRADGSQRFTTAFELIEWWAGVVVVFGWVCGRAYFRRVGKVEAMRFGMKN
jgi:hypothetical protein